MTAGADNPTTVRAKSRGPLRTHWFSVKMHEPEPEAVVRMISAEGEIVSASKKLPRTETVCRPALRATAKESERNTNELESV